MATSYRFQSPWIRFARDAIRVEVTDRNPFQSPWIRFARGYVTYSLAKAICVSIPVDKVRARHSIAILCFTDKIIPLSMDE